MSSSQIRGILFDAAGTLFHLRESVGEGYARVALRHGLSLPAAATDHGFRNAWKSMPPMGSPLGIEADRSEKHWWRSLVFKVVREVCPEESYDFDSFFADLFAEYAKPELWKLYAETLQVLELLAQRGLRLFVLSNFDSRLLPILDGLGLTDHFERIFYSGEIGHAKPSPEIFSYVLAATALKPEQTLHVGDDPTADWQGARTAGLQVYELERKQADLNGVLELENLPDFSD